MDDFELDLKDHEKEKFKSAVQELWDDERKYRSNLPELLNF